MKLYTEEQVKHTLQLMGESYLVNEFLKIAKSIELPSDEEIEKETWGFILGRNIAGFINGAKWMKQQILNQNK